MCSKLIFFSTMMKLKNVFILITLSLFFNLSKSFAQSQGEIISIARQGAALAAQQIMKEISPNTGTNPDYEIDYESIIYDPYAKEIECKILTTWTAKTYMLSLDRSTCQVWGKLYIDLSKGKSYMKSRFIPIGKNSHAEACASSHWASIATGLAFYISLK